MSVPAGVRQQVRQRANYRCEFCGAHEADAGGELTIDHYRPQASGGSDDPDNLTYACYRCNLYKHDYWPESPDSPPLWNPREELFATHFIERPGGLLEPRTPSGALTIRQLRLNRSQLVGSRQRAQHAAESQKQLGLYHGIVAVLAHLLTEQSELADEQKDLLQDLRRLLARIVDPPR